jgi:glycerol uptake facilitator-like aquaporin
MHSDPWRASAAEALGTAMLLWAIVGSGIVVAHDGPLIAQLLPHALVVGLALTALITMLAPISGAHFNPAVTLAAVLTGGLSRSRAAAYVVAQVAGAVLGTMLANLTAGLPAVTLSGRGRDGTTLLVSEVGATLMLVLLILLMVRAGRSSATIAAVVGGYIAAAIVFTPSTSFANPAVTLARTLSDTFTGIAPPSVPGFVAAQLAGAVGAVALAGWLGRTTVARAAAPGRETPHQG